MQERKLTEQLNELLRSELSAVETYSHALKKAKRDSSELKTIQNEHREAANFLVTQITEMGGVPDQNATTWKNLMFIADASGEPLEDPMLIRALKEGEAQDILSYEMLLENSEVKPNIKSLVTDTLLPRTRAHLKTLDRLLVAA